MISLTIDKEKDMNYELCLTTHFIKRMQQRGVSLEVIDIILLYGEVSFHKGAEIIALSKQSICELISESISKQLLAKASKSYLVVKNEKFLTVAVRYKKHKRDA